MKNTTEKFKGIHVPIITCFKGPDGRGDIDKAAQKRVTEYVMNEQDCDGIIACATTGEASLLSDAEYKKAAKSILETAKSVRENTLVLLGTSHLDPKITQKRNRFAKEAGFDGVLLTHPPYMKPDQKGIEAFFEEIAKADRNLAIIVYNIWYRTGGKGIEAKTLIELAKISNIKGVKDAGVSIEHTDEVIRETANEDFAYLTGEDVAYFDTLTHGGHGAIAATAHIIGKEMKAMLALTQEEKIKDSLEIFRKIRNIIKLLFVEPNPAPLKAAFNELGLKVGEPRAPTILSANRGTKKLIKNELKKLGKL